MPRHRAIPTLALAATLALGVAVAGCSGGAGVLDDLKDVSFNKPTFSKPDWALLQKVKTAELGPRGPVPPEQLVDAAGRCVATAQPAEAPQQEATAQPPEQPSAPDPAAANAQAPAQARAQARVGSIAGDLASAPMPQGPPPAPAPAKPTPKRMASANPRDLGGLQPEVTGPAGTPVMGGVALGMTECQAVRRAGPPNQVTIGTGDQGVRKVVLTYASGPWPGVYTFEAGRLKVIDAAAVTSQPPKPQRKTRKPDRTASGERAYAR